MDYFYFIRTAEDGFKWRRLKDQLRPFLSEDGSQSTKIGTFRFLFPIFTVTLGENQDTVYTRIDSFKKGYLCGSPDLIINNLHKCYSRFAIEMKSPTGNGVLSPDQSMMLLQYQNNGFKTLVSNDYDHIIEQLIEYFRDVRIKCSYCPRRFISS